MFIKQSGSDEEPIKQGYLFLSAAGTAALSLGFIGLSFICSTTAAILVIWNKPIGIAIMLGPCSPIWDYGIIGEKGLIG